MSSPLPDDAWVQSFQTAQQRPLLNLLQKRLQTSNNHLNGLAEIYKERAAIEATYAASLSKLARNAEQGQLSGKGGNEWDKISGEGRLWDAVINELSETSTSHSTLSAILKTDFEQPIRELPNKIVQWRRINEQESSLDKTLKEWEKVSSKLDKAASKSKSSRADALQGELDQLSSSLASLSPMVYTTYQRLDEARLAGLKEVIVRWGTVRADMATRDGERAERVVAVLLGWESSEEVLNVGRRLAGNTGGGGAGGRPAPTTPQNRRLSTATNNTSDFSPRPAARQNSSYTNGGTPSGFTGGLKSMLGRKSTIIAPSNGRTRSGSEATSTRSGRAPAGFDAVGEEEHRPDGVISTPAVDDEGFSVAPSDRHRNPWEDPNELIPTPAASHNAPPASSTFSQNFTSSPSGSNDNLSLSSNQPTQPRLNLALATAPIQESEEERQAALAKMQQTLQMPPSQPSRRGTVARGRRDVRNTMFGVMGVGEDGALGTGAAGVGAGAGAMALGQVSQPRLTESPENDVSNGHGSSNGQPGLIRQSSINSVTSNNPFDSPGLGGSSSFAQSQSPASGPGLRAQLNETFNVILKSNGISRIQVTGEIHLSLRPSASLSSSGGPVHIRLTSFESLEKVAPNPQYLAQVPDKPGEYFLNSEVLAGASQSGGKKGPLLFRYHVHVPAGSEKSMVPLLVQPAFQCKEGETRLIVNYKSNSSPLDTASISDLKLSAAFESSDPEVGVTNVQAKPPGGVWSPTTRRMNWSIGAVPAEGKIVARFLTEAGGVLNPQGVYASWTAEGLVSGLGIEIVNGGEWRFEEVVKGISTGKYLAEP